MNFSSQLTPKVAPVRILEALAAYVDEQKPGFIARTKRSLLSGKSLGQISWGEVSATQAEGRLTGLVGKSLKNSAIKISITQDGTSLLYELHAPKGSLLVLIIPAAVMLFIPPLWPVLLPLVLLIVVIAVVYPINGRSMTAQLHKELESMVS